MNSRNTFQLLICLANFFLVICCKKNAELDPNLPPTSFTVSARLSTNKSDIVLTWTTAKDPNGDAVTYSVIYKDTLVQHLIDTTYTLKNVGFNTSIVGTVIAFDSHKAATSASFTVVTGNEPLPRLRLLKIEGASTNYSYTSTYAYDGQNRLSSVNSSSSGLMVCVYDDVRQTLLECREYPRSDDLTTGTALQYLYNFPQALYERSFTAIRRPIKNSAIDSSFSAILGGKSYGYSNDHRYLYVSTFYGPPPGYTSGRQHYVYQFTGENIAKQGFNIPNNYADSTFFEYDNKLNPFFGLVSPDIGEEYRFSRNNITKKTSFNYPNTSIPYYTIVYKYEYNQQGYPTRQTLYQDGKELEVRTYTYESY